VRYFHQKNKEELYKNMYGGGNPNYGYYGGHRHRGHRHQGYNKTGGVRERRRMRKFGGYGGAGNRSSSNGMVIPILGLGALALGGFALSKYGTGGLNQTSTWGSNPSIISTIPTQFETETVQKPGYMNGLKSSITPGYTVGKKVGRRQTVRSVPFQTLPIQTTVNEPYTATYTTTVQPSLFNRIKSKLL